ncbi:MAG: Uma2 family endonuclease [Thermomicrobiales bacterium]|nr:Uma2 family endonuclease [Thermomicrobiales bacterium]
MGDKARLELIKGELHDVNPSGTESSMIAMFLAETVGPFVRSRKLGIVTDAQGGYILSRNPDTVVAPDIGYVRRQRIPQGHDFTTFFPAPPDIAIEVVSLTDRTAEILGKVTMYADAEVPLVWVVYPKQRAVTVHVLGEPPRTLHEGELLDGGEILPGFSLAVSEIFADPLAD